MNWESVAKAPLLEGELKLYRRGPEFSIRLNNLELMNSRVYGSEQALARLACEELQNAATAKVLVGGLGMGFTLRAALEHLGPHAAVTVAELVPAVVRWNREVLGHLTEHPLRDDRTTLFEGDVAEVLRQPSSFDAILLDVDNGPEGLTQASNARLYSAQGLTEAFRALRACGVLAVWSAHPSRAFTQRLQRAGFAVEEKPVRARGSRGARHTVWLAVKKN